MRNKLYLLFVLILAVIPFFWFKPGEMNLGGDSSRLYFYDPLNYLLHFPLYNIAPGQAGDFTISYFFVPFTVLLVVLRGIFQSPSLLINAFHSFMLVTAFLFVYFSLRELAQDGTKHSDGFSGFAGIVAGLLYIFSPTMWNWDKAISSHNQLFLNPLMFYLFLRFIKTDDERFLYGAALLSFLFAPNFSFVAAPPIFAFYPAVIIFLLIYKTAIVKTQLNVRAIVFASLLMLGIHALHVVPQLVSLFDRSSSTFHLVFSSASSVLGLTYFNSTRLGILLSNNIALLTLLPGSNRFIASLGYVGILCILGGAWASQTANVSTKKILLLLLAITLTLIFLTTANVTNFGVVVYKFLFSLPGFSMFKNFYGQFIYSASFFYALTVGLSVFLMLTSIKKFQRALFLSLLIVFTVLGWPFINGKMVNLPILGSKDVKVPFQMDPQFEQVLQHIREDSVDGKFLTLPLTDFGYQMLAGTNGGMYIGPSFIGYLTGKKDYMGFDTLAPFSQIFFDYIKNGDMTSVKKLLSLLNIRYVFYNNDTAIYDQFEEFPYGIVKQIFPTRKSILNFIEALGATKVYEKGKYTIYMTPEYSYLPHFYVPTFLLTMPLSSGALPLSALEYADPRIAFVDGREIPTQETIIAASTVDYSHIYKVSGGAFPNYVRYPYVKWKYTSPVYPLVAIKEAYLLHRQGGGYDEQVNQELFFAAKRISELSRWERDFSVQKNISSVPELLDYWHDPQFLNVFGWTNYGSWEAVLSRYMHYIDNAIGVILAQQADNTSWSINKKLEVLQSLDEHETFLNRMIRTGGRPTEEKIYLLSLLGKLFDYYNKKLTIESRDPSVINYEINIPQKEFGTYDIYIEDSAKNPINADTYTLRAENQIYRVTGIKRNAEWLRFGSLAVDTPHIEMTLNIPKNNIAQNIQWKPYEPLSVTSEKDALLFRAFRTERDDASSFIASVSGFQPKKNYLISFTYFTHGNDFKIKLLAHQNVEAEGTAYDLYAPVLGTVKKNKEWSTFYGIINSYQMTDGVFVIVPPQEDYAQYMLEIKNFSVSELPIPPSIIFVKKGVTQLQSMGPHITFSRINPTKYLVHVEGAQNPYTLVFSEAFHKDWKLYSGSGSGNTVIQSIVARFVRVVLDIGARIYPTRYRSTNSFSYFGGDIREENYQNTFLSSSTFETVGKLTIADGNHFPVNGYANGWYIRPEDVGQLSSYDLIVEMSSERLFYIGSGVSILSLFIAVGVLVKRRGRFI